MKTYGISFKDGGKIYYFNYEKEDLNLKDKVIVQTENGEQFGIVNKILEEPIFSDEVKPILRKTTKEDMKQIEKNQKEATEALEQAKKIAKKLNLKMSFIDASFNFNKKQLLFNFIADERVDFRELAKSLARIYKTRIELRQVGVRDKAKEIGGIGQCGRCLCCKNFLNHIGSISINMVKNQNIAINPSKINGQCGRLLCCLTYEDEEYTRCQKGMPQVGDEVNTEHGKGKVISVDILNRMYKVDIDGNKEEIRLSCENCPK